MLSWIPLLGPIIQGVSSIFTGYFSVKTVALQTASATTIAETQASVQIIHDTSDDICIRILRDGICLFPVVWTAVVGWDTLMAYHYPKLMWHVPPYPPSLTYLPYAVMVFLLGNIGLNMWNRK